MRCLLSVLRWANSATYRWNPMLVPRGPFIQVDIEQSMIGRGFPVTEGIVAEAGAFFRAMWDQAPLLAKRREGCCSTRH